MTGVIGTDTGTSKWPEPTRDGYELAGWFSDAACTQEAGSFPATYEEGTVAFYAKWTALDASIAFDAKGGSAVEAISGKTGDAIANRTMPESTREGYTLAGWFDNEQYTGTSIPTLPATIPAGTTTYYAKWEAGTSTITFDANGGSSVMPMTGTVGSNLPSTALPTSTRAGYTLEGWYAER